jgi:hypothetical protein
MPSPSGKPRHDDLMKFDGIDPHLSGGGSSEPDYEVSFWSWQGTGWLESWVTIQEADVDEVLEWVRENAEGRHFTVWARSIVQQVDGRLTAFSIRLVGTEPTAGDSEYPRWARRHTPEQGPPSPPDYVVSRGTFRQIE